ncbi:MAG: ABC transporter ATP-binding protein [Spirochaetales bacterium]|nr:ABC transporter ATP-binding protein [Spirochaetales bacterium]
MIRIENIRFDWVPGTKLINIPELSVEKGEKVLIKGESGSGKTTLLTLLTGIQTVNEGILEVDGVELKSLKPAQRDRFRGDHLGYIFQQFNLIPYLSIEGNIQAALTFSERKRSREQENVGEKIDSLLEELGLSHAKDKPVRELSIGQQQRVALARALMGRPALIIADEPTSSLDGKNRVGFMNLLIKECEKEGTTLLVVSHDPEIDEHFDRIVEFHEINGEAHV